MIKRDIIIIGGGPAGLMAALQAKLAAPEVSVSLLEKGPRPGRKLIVAGAGQCNYTHVGDVDSFLGRYGGGEKAPGDPDEDGCRPPGSAGRFLKPALHAFPPSVFTGWLEARGVASVVDEYNGKIYPASRRSMDILQVFLAELKRVGVILELNAAVGSISRDAGGFVLQVGQGGPDAQEQFACRQLLIASGGHTYQLTGSSGDGWNLARSLGHNVSDIGPALAPVHVADFAWADCAGISFQRWPVEIRDRGRLVARNVGDLLITHTGLSGPAVIDSSRWIRPGFEIITPLGGMAGLSAAGESDTPRRPFRNLEEAENAVLDLASRHSKRLVSSIVQALCPGNRLADHLCRLVGIAPDLRVSQLSREARRQLSQLLAGTAFRVGRLGGLDEAMASRGGVCLDEIDPKTMASRKVPGLYFAGEVVDVDGDSGGFNIQAAVSMGYVAGKAMAAACSLP